MASSLVPRYKNHHLLNTVVRQDWITAIELSPDAFQALLYVPVESEADDIADELEQSTFNQVDVNQVQHEYSDPITVYVLDNPDDMRPMVLEAGGQSVSDFEQPVALRVGHHNVPVGAILEWEEVATLDDDEAEDTRRCWWYVHHSISLGTTLSAAVHYVIPCCDFEGLPSEDEETEDEEQPL